MIHVSKTEQDHFAPDIRQVRAASGRADGILVRDLRINIQFSKT